MSTKRESFQSYGNISDSMSHSARFFCVMRSRILGAWAASRRFMVIASLLGLIQLAGCATTVPPSYSDEVKYVASKQAVLADAKLGAIVSACQEISGTLAGQAKTVRAGWHSRNWIYVSAADKQITARVRQLQSQQGRLLGQLDIWNFLQKLSHSEVKGLRERVLKTDSRDKACLRRLEPFTLEENDLIAHPQYSDIYASMVWSSRNERPTQPHAVPTFKPTISPAENLGRSMLSVESLAAKTICGDYTVINLRNEWPKETYGVLCGNVGKALVDCHWGNCELSQSY